MPPAVSIVIPTFDRERQVLRAIDSCRSAARSVELQVLVVDDASTDGTVAAIAARDDNVEILRSTENRGQAIARNRGLAAAQGEFVKFLDSDDLLLEGALDREVERARRDGIDLLVSGWMRAAETPDGAIARETAEQFSPPELSPLPDRILQGCGAPVSAVLYRRSFLEGLAWDPEIRHPDDWFFFCSVALRGPRAARMEEPAFLWIDHPGQRASGVSMLEYARNHHRILRFIRRELESRGELNGDRRRALARYFYRQMPVLARTGGADFEDGVAEILDLDPRFHPGAAEPRFLARGLASVVGLRRALRWRAAAAAVLRRKKVEEMWG